MIAMFRRMKNRSRQPKTIESVARNEKRLSVPSKWPSFESSADYLLQPVPIVLPLTRGVNGHSSQSLSSTNYETNVYNSTGDELFHAKQKQIFEIKLMNS